jgi:NhaC family Na+:H+ antiporter
MNIGISIVSAVLVAWLVQGVPLLHVLGICILGYHSSGEGLGAILDGGGLVSMLEIAGILVISCAYSGIFSGTDMLREIQNPLLRGCQRFGRYVMTLAVGIMSSVVFCNQTISTLLVSDLMKKPYRDLGGSWQELAIDMENSVILIACTIPWTIGVMVPLSFMGVGVESMLYAFYMILVPVWYWFDKKKWFNEKEKSA